ncbi:hydrogenase maturation factor, partial [Bacillus sp. AFS075960]
MTRAYTYRGYTIDVDCEFRLDDTPDADTMDDAHFGFVAVVQV